MSQQQKRRGATVVGENRRGNVPKATPNVPQNPPETELKYKTTNNHKIPKNLRYDLQTALINLCDVWFEDIKPHLIRNNIKLHIHDHKPKASGDFERQTGPTTGCSHLDPGAASDRCRRRGASSVGFSSTPATASRARSPKRRPARPKDLSPLYSLPTSPKPSTKNLSPDCKAKQQGQPRTRRKCRRETEKHSTTENASPLRIPRLSLKPSSQSPPSSSDIKTLYPPRNNSYQSSALLQSTNRKHVLLKTKGPLMTTPDFVLSSNYQTLPQQPLHRKRTNLIHKGTQTDFKCTCNVMTFSSRTVNVKPHSKPSAWLPLPALNEMPSSPLFKKDLLDIILCEKNSKTVSVLYNNPAKDTYSSILSSDAKETLQVSQVVKKPPWR